MKQQNKVTGVVLAGGLARRMNKQDKGLILYHDKPLVSYALNALSKVARKVYINANRNLNEYNRFNYEVISDQTDSFDGPLAGILSAMSYASTEILLVIPCDSPLIKAEHVEKLLSAINKEETEIAVAYDGQRIQPVFLALKIALKDSLNNYLLEGNRKIDKWLQQHKLTQVDFSKNTEIFLNINTMSELNALEKSKG
jgi:molybdopterin-guanine dinucleotide biosynthesis protein A